MMTTRAILGCAVAVVLATLALASLTGCSGVPRAAVRAPSPSQTQPRAATDQPTSAPSHATATADPIAQARTAVEQFFGEPFRAPFDVKVFANRAALTDFARQRWKMEKTECWMVAMGVSSLMVILSPEAWKTDACEHEPTPQHIREIFTHELVHVFHGQHNPSHEFDGMHDAGWFVEGLAIHAAGQLSEQRMSRLRKALSEGHSPARLADAWSGDHRYAISGSLVRFIEDRWGRETLKNLLPATSNSEILAMLHTTEDDLLTTWRRSVSEVASSPAPAGSSSQAIQIAPAPK